MHIRQTHPFIIIKYSKSHHKFISFFFFYALKIISLSPIIFICRFDEYDDDMICENLEEASIALDHAKDSSTLLLKLAENMDGYSLDSSGNENRPIYSKKIGIIDIGRLQVTIPSASKVSNIKQYLAYKNNLKINNHYYIYTYLFFH